MSKYSRNLQPARGLAAVAATIVILFATIASVSKAPAQVAVVMIAAAPPVLPVYDQPPIPGPGYIWTPGYWAWGDGDYYWVPGTWVEPPAIGLLWTPGYWAWGDGTYVWNAGYWGPHVGFYGGVNYGFGYYGVGYAGGLWRGGAFAYNTAVNNFGGVYITNVYNQTVTADNVTNVSFNGGAGGLTTQPSAQETAAASERHTPPTNAQAQHQQMASTNRDMRASANGGQPRVAATSHAGHFNGAGVVGSHRDGGMGGPGHNGGMGRPGGGGQQTFSHGPAGGPAYGPAGSANMPKQTSAPLNGGSYPGNGGVGGGGQNTFAHGPGGGPAHGPAGGVNMPRQTNALPNGGSHPGNAGPGGRAGGGVHAGGSPAGGRTAAMARPNPTRAPSPAPRGGGSQHH
jgi:WXXGXW repeat (2 copies)